MWRGVFPAVTTKFTTNGELDKAEMERCFALQFEADVDGMIVCGSLGEAMTLEPEEKLEILSIATSVAGGKPVLMTVCESSTRRAVSSAKAAAAKWAAGFMVLPGVPHKSAPAETLGHIEAVAAGGGMPVMVYNNPIAYGRRHAFDVRSSGEKRPCRRNEGIDRRYPPGDRNADAVRRAVRLLYRRR